MESEQTKQKLTDEGGVGAWELDGALLMDRALEWIGVTPEHSLLMRFSGPVYVGFKTALRIVDGDMAVPTVRVYTFPGGVSEEGIAQTKTILPNDDAPAVLKQVIGERVAGVHSNSATGLEIPPSCMPGGWYIAFGERPTYIEVNIQGLNVHAPAGGARVTLQ